MLERQRAERAAVAANCDAAAKYVKETLARRDAGESVDAAALKKALRAKDNLSQEWGRLTAAVHATEKLVASLA